MPFIYDLLLHEDEPDYTLTQHLVPEGTMVETGQAIAVLTDGKMDFHLPAPMQGLLVAWLSQAGDCVNIAETIARVVCEGPEVEVPTSIPQRLG